MKKLATVVASAASASASGEDKDQQQQQEKEHQKQRGEDRTDRQNGKRSRRSLSFFHSFRESFMTIPGDRSILDMFRDTRTNKQKKGRKGLKMR